MSNVALARSVEGTILSDPLFLGRWEEPLTSSGKWRAANPIKVRAHAAVAKALRDGILKRGKCEDCGSFRVEAHHDDYDKPLDVRWLCRRHHVEFHVLLRRQQKAAEQLAKSPVPRERKGAIFKRRVLVEVNRRKLSDAEAARVLRDLCLHYATKADIPASDMIVGATEFTGDSEEARNGCSSHPR
jgi:hypothetical protein